MQNQQFIGKPKRRKEFKMQLSNRQQEIITQILNIPYIKAQGLIKSEPYRILFFIEESIDSLKRQLILCINQKSDNDLITTYQEKITELVALQTQIAENIDTKHLKTSFVC